MQQFYLPFLLSEKKCLDFNESIYKKNRLVKGCVKSITKLVLDLQTFKKENYNPIFRLFEFKPIVLVMPEVKVKCEHAEISGVKFVKPADWDGWLT